jgi:hypothetical protein
VDHLRCWAQVTLSASRPILPMPRAAARSSGPGSLATATPASTPADRSCSSAYWRYRPSVTNVAPSAVTRNKAFEPVNPVR